jgi:hypothetical protein
MRCANKGYTRKVGVRRAGGVRRIRTLYARLGQTMSLITREKISPEMVNIMI